MSEQSAEQISSESGSITAGTAVPLSSEAPVQPVAASAQETPDVASPDLVPGEGSVEVAAPKADSARAESDQAESRKADAPRSLGKLMIMSDAGRGNAGPETKSGLSREIFGKRRLAVAAMLALAVAGGALGGALATAGISRVIGGEVASADRSVLEASVARIDADIAALKAGVEHSSRLALSQYNKASDRLDKVEKAQAEPAAKLAKLSEAVDRLRASPPAAAPAPTVAPAPAAAAPAAAKEITGSVTPPATTPAAAPKPEVGRLPTVEGWVLRDVGNGGALIQGRRGMFEVYAGDPIPGVGRVDAIRRQDGRWVVVTSKGLIVAR